MRIVFLGLPGVGKGTQAKRLAESLGVPHISTGDMFRDPTVMGTEVGRKAKAIMEKGDLVPDEIVDGMVAERLKLPDAAAGYVLDGYPRTLPQGGAFEALLKTRGETLDAVLYLEAPEEVVVERLSGRRSCRSCATVYHLAFNPPAQEGTCDRCGEQALYQRDDDRPEAVRNRLKVYKELTGPLVPFYRERGMLTALDGTGDADEVFRRVSGAVKHGGR